MQTDIEGHAVSHVDRHGGTCREMEKGIAQNKQEKQADFSKEKKSGNIKA